MIDYQEPTTFFASEDRVSDAVLQQEVDKAAHSEIVSTLLNAMPDFLMVLNEKRQILAANQRLLTAFGVEHPEELLGLRPGEAVGCIHAKDGPGGCGTAKKCAVCGAVLAILASQDSGLPQQRECQLITGKDCHALDLDVLATPVTIEGEHFTIVALRDISSKKRRDVMERVFFHDILNCAGGIRGLAALLQDGTSPAAEQQFKGWMVTMADNMIEEISHQRRLLDAERGIYNPVFEPVNLAEMLHDVRRLYENHERVPGRKLELAEPPACVLITDRSLLRRIVGNMVLNALEACKRGDTVTIWTHIQDSQIQINVTNPGEIPAEVQLHLFNRSFSTKAKEGRGLGTYSMKLFGERYLGGKVNFYSNNGMTTFFIELPAEPDISSTS
jgi:signal transduction histidine kinase